MQAYLQAIQIHRFVPIYAINCIMVKWLTKYFHILGLNLAPPIALTTHASSASERVEVYGPLLEPVLTKDFCLIFRSCKGGGCIGGGGGGVVGCTYSAILDMRRREKWKLFRVPSLGQHQQLFGPYKWHRRGREREKRERGAVRFEQDSNNNETGSRRRQRHTVPLVVQAFACPWRNTPPPWSSSSSLLLLPSREH